ncbi:MAG TPA: hypothetical protein VGN32_19930 [Ktedonobacterales bacterium]|nr:hypothetical protein [Ktedonobacterales bacterium]
MTSVEVVAVLTILTILEVHIMLTLDGIENTAALAALLGLHAEWCPAGAHLRAVEGCRNKACHQARCHDVAHSYRRYSAGSEYGRYVEYSQPIPAGLVPYAEGPIMVDANGAPRLVTGRRWSGERYALPAPTADWLIAVRFPGDSETCSMGLCDAHWQERRATAASEWSEELERIRGRAPALATQLAQAAQDWRTIDRIEAADREWLYGEARRYRSLLDLAEGRGWLQVGRGALFC